MSNNAAEHQKDPEKNTLPCVQDMVIADLEARKQVGIERYGTVLQPFNGRSALMDAYQENLDLSNYLRQAIYEEEAKAKRIHALLNRVKMAKLNAMLSNNVQERLVIAGSILDTVEEELANYEQGLQSLPTTRHAAGCVCPDCDRM